MKFILEFLKIFVADSAHEIGQGDKKHDYDGKDDVSDGVVGVFVFPKCKNVGLHIVRVQLDRLHFINKYNKQGEIILNIN